MKLKERLKKNDKIRFVLEVWDNKRYRSIILLCAYFIFFFIIINVIRNNYDELQDNQVSKKVATDQTNEITSDILIQNSINSMISMDYVYNITAMSFELPEIKIEGLYQKNIEKVNYNDLTYNIINNNLYLSDDDNLIKVTEDIRPFIIPVESLSLINIKEYALDGAEVAKKSIDDNTNIIEYIIPINSIECHILITYSQEKIISLSTVYNDINVEITYKKVGEV